VERALLDALDAARAALPPPPHAAGGGNGGGAGWGPPAPSAAAAAALRRGLAALEAFRGEECCGVVRPGMRARLGARGGRGGRGEPPGAAMAGLVARVRRPGPLCDSE
jgi:hypothetical protein